MIATMDCMDAHEDYLVYEAYSLYEEYLYSSEDLGYHYPHPKNIKPVQLAPLRVKHVIKQPFKAGFKRGNRRD